MSRTRMAVEAGTGGLIWLLVFNEPRFHLKRLQDFYRETFLCYLKLFRGKFFFTGP